MQFRCPSGHLKELRLERNIGCWFVRVEQEIKILQNILVFPSNLVVPVYPILPRVPRSLVSTKVHRDYSFVVNFSHLEKIIVLS